MRIWCALVVFVVGIGGFGSDAGGATIFDNGSPDLLNGYISDFEYQFQSTDNFILQAGASTITDLHWYGGYADNNPGTDDFLVRIFQSLDASAFGGVVVSEVSVGNSASRVATGTQVANNYPLYAYSVDVAPIVLDPGVQYWLAIINDTSHAWFWATSNDLTGDGLQRFPPAGWTTNFDDFELAFSLTDDAVVPEPGALALLGIGLVALAGSAYRRRSVR